MAMLNTRLSREDALLRWLVEAQEPHSGFLGRTNKKADTCYSFWVGASLKVGAEIRGHDP